MQPWCSRVVKDILCYDMCGKIISQMAEKVGAVVFLLAAVTADGALGGTFLLNQYKLLKPLSLSSLFSMSLSLRSIVMQHRAHHTWPLQKAACTLVDLGLAAFVAKVCDLTHSFYYTDSYTNTYKLLREST